MRSEKEARFTFASSAAIYGDPDSIPIRESDPKQHTSLCGLEKYSADQYCQLYNELYDVETVVLRYFNVYGPRQRGGQYSGVIDVFLEQADQGDGITVHGGGEQTRDLVHVDDVVAASCLVAVDKTPGEAYNVRTGESISIRELAESLIQSVETMSNIVHVEAREGDIKQSCPSIEKIQTELEFDPQQSLEAELETLW